MLLTTDPTSGKLVRETAPLDSQGLDTAISQAQAASLGWRELSFGERAEIMKKVAQYMRDHTEELAPLMTEEMGKPIKEARGEVAKAAWCAEHYADHAEQYLARQEIESDASLSYV